MIQINTANFHREILLAKGVGLLVFGAQWCGPSLALFEILQRLEPDFPTIVIGTINIDLQSGIVQHWKIRGTPTMIAFKEGEPVASRIGASTYDQVREWFEELCG